jgi:hypothetical protein
MLDTQNQSPQCVDCDSPMTLTAIEPGGLGQDLRAFTCEKCKRVERHIMECRDGGMAKAATRRKS